MTRGAYVFKRLIKPFCGFIASILIIFSVEQLPFPDIGYSTFWADTTTYLKSALDNGGSPPIWKPLFFLIAIFIYIIISVMHLRNILRDYAKCQSMDTDLNRIWSIELKAFDDNINLTSRERITLFIYLDTTQNFFKAARESKNPSFKNSGRAFYSDGLIDRAFCTGEQGILETVVADPLIDPKGYVKEVQRSSGMKLNQVKKLSMNSRCLYARQVSRLNNTPIGVLLIETLNENFTHICYDEEKFLDNERLDDIFSRECRRLSHYLDVFEEPKNLFEFEEGFIDV